VSLEKSFVLTATFPSARSGVGNLKKALEYIKPYNFSTVEYYCDEYKAEEIRKLFGNQKTILLAAALQKSNGLNPSSSDTGTRKKAVDLLTECFKFAGDAGASAVLINSGPRPEKEQDDETCLEYLAESIIELHHRVPDINILLEPGDRDVEYRHLLGHMDKSVAFIRNIRPEVPNISLTFDISHIAQLNEELYGAWSTAKDYCTHVHLANCVLNKTSPLYGDKHPLFSAEDSAVGHERAREFYNFLKNEERPITVGIEVICHYGPEEKLFQGFVNETGWFFNE